tara:strand:- start:568 stop:810 length:243 start_codon:yes stop_codon:yes gene_type:complete
MHCNKYFIDKSVLKMNNAAVLLIFPTPLKKGAWSQHERDALLLHVELLGPKWRWIAHSMNRSYYSIANQHRDELKRKKRD